LPLDASLSSYDEMTPRELLQRRGRESRPAATTNRVHEPPRSPATADLLPIFIISLPLLLPLSMTCRPGEVRAAADDILYFSASLIISLRPGFTALRRAYRFIEISRVGALISAPLLNSHSS
jgi:hypothetical protein